jgi:hypothetical protein
MTTPLEIARKTRLLLDRLAKDAADAEDIAKKLPEPDPDETIAAIHQAPSALRAWAEQLAKGYAVARDESNALAPKETAYRARLDKAIDLVSQAYEARNEIQGQCKHRIRLEDPIINVGNGEALYPDWPTCTVCGEEFELEWYCQDSPHLRCEYVNPEGRSGPGFIHGSDVEEFGGEWSERVQCVHCGEPWHRER